MTCKVTLPDGWSYERMIGHDDHVVVRARTGYVTVDFGRRGFRLGWSAHGALVGEAGPTAYNGRGWRERLITNAVAHLRRVEES